MNLHSQIHKPIPPRARIIISCVSKETGVPVYLIMRSTRGNKQTIKARFIAQYLVRKIMSKASQTQIAGWFGRDHSTMSHAMQVIEHRIASDDLTALFVDRIEAVCRQAIEDGMSKQTHIEKAANRDGAIICGV